MTLIECSVCVLPQYQGKGYGHDMLARVGKLLAERCKQVRLGVVTHHRRALNLYQSIGFEAVAEFHYYVIDLKDI
ncbi:MULTISPECIES: GNAT family N-acetyltransferase [Brevibacillus]|uniref:GNAT family N-acetyltransferase n=1 Tax=Brevibacillus TaxID=55080 RepID=UPI0009D9C07F|nr:GNAT family N-acetyltransferase [Brevibacillus borstelensis]MCC0562898.1 GNAT family N-acetyltransferase [Brevibacillus borstelensis]NOU56727.1 GNAT family N-acetyltransferase [Brevibacillus borstelensis]RNB61815.1 N-acetyltransferase [Brevibacillus borstelensis]